MEIKRTDKEILIKIPVGTDLTGIQRLLAFIRFREPASKSKASQEDIDQLSQEAKESWWSLNKEKFRK